MAPGSDIGEWVLRGLGAVPAFSLKHAHGLKCCQPGQGWGRNSWRALSPQARPTTPHHAVSRWEAAVTHAFAQVCS